MASLAKVIKDDRHPLWLVDAIILSAVVYSDNPDEELKALDMEYRLPATAKYEYLSQEELCDAGFTACKQTLLVVRSLVGNHIIVAFRGTNDVRDTLTDLNIIHRSLSLGDGAAHSGFLHRAKSIPLEYFRRLLVRGENLVLTGHSLGGAVASLLTLRLLESTGRWCHQQVQCYTFGCPFFADFRLARHINTRYKEHFVHIVSRSDIVPKVMPFAYVLYNLWAGLQAGPLEDLFHFSRLALLALQLTKTKPKVSDKYGVITMASHALRWVPGLMRWTLHRLIALTLAFQSGYGYFFAGHMVLLDPETQALELAERECWTFDRHLSFHFGGVSLDLIKDHSLVSYIEHVFTVQAAAAGGSCKLEAATVKVQITSFKTNKLENNGQNGLKQICMMDVERCMTTVTKRKEQQKKRAVQALRSRVACIIFARRLQEASPSSFRHKHQRGMFKVIFSNIGRVARYALRFEGLMMASSLLYAGVQIGKICRRQI